MTTEIAIINRQGIALAADSAATIGNNRVWKTANKMFSLSPYNDIGIMIYGNATFLDIPWEILIKQFREKNNFRFLTVDDCAKKFIDYLESDKISNSELEERSIILLCFAKIKEIFLKIPEDKDKNNFFKNFSTALTMLDATLEKEQLIFSDAHFDFSKFQLYFKEDIDDLLNQTFENFPSIEDSLRLRVYALCYETYRRSSPSTSTTGIVIAGFGENELFPVLLDYTIDGKFSGKIRKWLKKEIDLNKNGSEAIVPFAQVDMIQLFMEGIAPHYLNYFEDFITKLLKFLTPSEADQNNLDYETLKGNILDSFQENFYSFRHEFSVKPFLNVLTTLPKEEMAAMAEALVELTSLKRKMDSNIESVGGPTDVAVISKGDGFIWLKRKHYFDIEYNKGYIERKQIQRERIKNEL